ncbi:ankyrin [Penicillium cf. viridicatum]|uniref:Ankyrin n=1 Tax=Penicillium cf. viridicatum TaxID=2972119 RepID=A0A9W9MJ74_9EURO|nr:ankyrin [Penicillium cf. viridicatum]
MLIRNGADVNVQGLHRGTPLQAAAREGWEDIVNARDTCHSTELHAASAKGHKIIAELLLRYGADPNVQGKCGIDTALQAGARVGYEEAVKLLLDKGAIVDARGGDGGTAIHAAVAEGHKHIVELLLSHGANYP